MVIQGLCVNGDDLPSGLFIVAFSSPRLSYVCSIGGCRGGDVECMFHLSPNAVCPVDLKVAYR